MGRMCEGVDVGASSVKAGLVETDAGVIVDRWEEKTPVPSTPDAVVVLVAEIAGQLSEHSPVGIAFPAGSVTTS